MSEVIQAYAFKSKLANRTQYQENYIYVSKKIRWPRAKKLNTIPDEIKGLFE